MSNSLNNMKIFAKILLNICITILAFFLGRISNVCITNDDCRNIKNSYENNVANSYNKYTFNNTYFKKNNYFVFIDNKSDTVKDTGLTDINNNAKTNFNEYIDGDSLGNGQDIELEEREYNIE